MVKAAAGAMKFYKRQHFPTSKGPQSDPSLTLGVIVVLLTGPSEQCLGT